MLVLILVLIYFMMLKASELVNVANCKLCVYQNLFLIY